MSLQLLLPKNTSKVLEPNSASPVLLKIDLQKCILTSGAEFHNDKCFTQSKYPKKVTSRKQIEMGESSFEIKMGGLDDFRETYLVYSVLK